jgi:hypothetical protein
MVRRKLWGCQANSQQADVMKGLEIGSPVRKVNDDVKSFLLDALPVLQEMRRVQRQMRAIQLRSDDYWPMLEYWIQTEWLLETGEILTEIMERYLPID